MRALSARRLEGPLSDLDSQPTSQEVLKRPPATVEPDVGPTLETLAVDVTPPALQSRSLPEVDPYDDIPRIIYNPDLELEDEMDEDEVDEDEAEQMDDDESLLLGGAALRLDDDE